MNVAMDTVHKLKISSGMMLRACMRGGIKLMSENPKMREVTFDHPVFHPFALLRRLLANYAHPCAFLNDLFSFICSGISLVCVPVSCRRSSFCHFNWNYWPACCCFCRTCGFVWAYYSASFVSLEGHHFYSFRFLGAHSFRGCNLPGLSSFPLLCSGKLIRMCHCE